jgi:2-keto-4-pentenoate hydratase
MTEQINDEKINIAKSNDELARLLWSAQRAGTQVPKGAAAHLDEAGGYAVQAAGLALRTAAGERLAGRKVGLTTSVAQRTVSASGPVSGYLLRSTITPVGDEFDCTGLVAPRLEVEVAFVLARPLQGPAVTPADVLAATAYLAPAFEVVDSRWEGGPAGAGALLADDVSAVAVIVGAEVDPAAVDLPGLRVSAQVGERAVTGDAGNVMGDPARSVAWLCADLHRRGEGLAAGDLVLSGALCGPVPVGPGETVLADLGPMGRLQTTFGSARS